jgi:hypothetical protein
MTFYLKLNPDSVQMLPFLVTIQFVMFSVSKLANFFAGDYSYPTA